MDVPPASSSFSIRSLGIGPVRKKLFAAVTLRLSVGFFLVFRANHAMSPSSFDTSEEGEHSCFSTPRKITSVSFSSSTSFTESLPNLYSLILGWILFISSDSVVTKGSKLWNTMKTVSEEDRLSESHSESVLLSLILLRYSRLKYVSFSVDLLLGRIPGRVTSPLLDKKRAMCLCPQNFAMSWAVWPDLFTKSLLHLLTRKVHFLQEHLRIVTWSKWNCFKSNVPYFIQHKQWEIKIHTHWRSGLWPCLLAQSRLSGKDYTLSPCYEHK